MVDRTKRDDSEVFEQLAEQVQARIPKAFYEKLAASRDPQEIGRLLTAEFTRVLDEIEAEA